MVDDGVILALDIGTTRLKLGLFDGLANLIELASCSYPLHTRGGERVEADPEDWWRGFLDCCARMRHSLSDVRVITMSEASPGTMMLDGGGNPLTPAVPFLDRRSSKQSRRIRLEIGEDQLLEKTGNLPTPGACGASTILWWRENEPALYQKAKVFAQTNTFFGHRLTGHFGIDPSAVSLTAMFNTTRPEDGWNLNIVEQLGLPAQKLPPIVNSCEVLGPLRSDVAKKVHLPEGVPVLMSGNDIALGALSGGLMEQGKVVDIMGTAEILTTCLEAPYPSPNYSNRCHVIPDRWITMYVLNTGGESLRWFAKVFCSDMDLDRFFDVYLPKCIRAALQRETEEGGLDVPKFIPFLSGDYYSPDEVRATITDLHLSHSRDDLLVGMIKTSMELNTKHLRELASKISLSREMILTGGAHSAAFVEAKKRWMGDFEYVIQEQSSLHGAALLGKIFLDRTLAGMGTATT
jgi:xylulokinase